MRRDAAAAVNMRSNRTPRTTGVLTHVPSRSLLNLRMPGRRIPAPNIPHCRAARHDHDRHQDQESNSDEPPQHDSSITALHKLTTVGQKSGV